MKVKSKRVVSKIFLSLTILAAIVLLAEGAYYATLQDWMPYEFVFKLPFELTHDHILMTFGITMILLVVTVWSFVLSFRRTRRMARRLEEQLEEEYWEEEAATYAVAPAQRPTLVASKQERNEKIKSAAKIVLPIVGICAVGIAVAVMMRRNKKD